MKHWPRRKSVWDGSTNPSNARSGRDPVNPIRIAILRRKGLSYSEIGRLIAKQDGRSINYTSQGIYHALHQYRIGLRDEEGEKIGKET